jgi:hypothetical protein
MPLRPLPVERPALSREQFAELRRRLFAAVRAGDDAKEPLWLAYRRECVRRRELVRAMDDSPAMQLALRAACVPPERTVDAYLDAFLFWLRTFGVVAEPREDAADALPLAQARRWESERAQEVEEPEEVEGDGNAAPSLSTLPFIAMPHQEDLAREVIAAYLATGPNGRALKATLFVEKARDIGATWLILALVVWLWLVERRFTAHLGSRVAELVDKNPGSQDEDTLFGRCEIILAAQPDYLRPRGFDLLDKNHRQMQLWINPDSRNRITGESANANFGRQQRKTMVVFDEIAFAEHQREIIRGTADTCRLRLFITSPDPDADGAKELMARPGVRVISHHWSMHPEKTLAWYEQQRRDRSEEEIANELDLSWEGGAERRIYAEWDSVPQGAYGYRPGWILWGAVDFGRADPTAIIVGQTSPLTEETVILACHQRAGEHIDFFLPFFGRPIKSGYFDYTADERALIVTIQQWIKRAGGVIWFGDPAGAQLTQAANTSVLDILAENQIAVITNERITSHDERQSRAKLLLRTCVVNMPACARLDLAMRNYRRPAQRNSTGHTKRAIHNIHSHLCAAFEYRAVNGVALLAGMRRAAPIPARHVAAYEDAGPAPLRRYA